MSIRKILSLCLALMLALGCFGALAEEDLQAQLDAANARIAELQAQVDTYYPYYEAQIVATFDPDCIIWLKDVQAQYDMVSAQYQSMGLDLAAYGMEESVKRDIVDSAVENNLLLVKAAELGLDQFDEAQLEKIEADADAEMGQYIESYLNYFHADEEVTDELREEAEQYWVNNGVKREDVLEASRKSAAAQAARDYAIKDVEINEDDVQAAYEAMIAENQQSYTNDRTYNSDRNADVAIAWNPEGYRAVKHVLVKFSDEQAQLYSDLQSQLSSLNAEKEAVQNPAEPEATDAAEDAEPTEEPEPTPEPRSVSEIDTDIAACAAEVEALYAELLPTAQEVIDAFNAGTDFDELIEKYNGDPGMQQEPTATIGYAVSANSTTWEQAFTDGAMAIANVGEISEPVYGSNGIHIIYYMGDITPGNVPLDEIRDSAIERADQEKKDAAYDAQLAKWMEEAHVVYHYENFGITPDETAEDEAKDEAAEELIEEAEEEPIEEVAEEEIEQEEAAEAEEAAEPTEAEPTAEEPEAAETEEAVEAEAPAEEPAPAETEEVVEAEAPAEDSTEAAE